MCRLRSSPVFRALSRLSGVCFVALVGRSLCVLTRELTLVVCASRVLGVCGLLPHAIMEFYIFGSDVGHSSLRLSRPLFIVEAD